MSREEWNIYRIGDIGKIITGKTPPTQNLDNFGEEYPFITPRDMVGQKKVNKTERYLSEEGKNSVKNCLLPANSICVSCIGSDMGKVVMTTTDSVTNQQLNSIICHPPFDPDFVYYALVNISEELRNAGRHSTAVPILNKSDFSNFEINAPNIAAQRRIAAILSALDEKIELNRQTNATLEAIAQAIFKEWFVDFHFPGATGKMQDSEVGLIPKGWKVGKIRDCAIKIQYGLTQSSSSIEVGPHFLRITDIQHGKINWDSVPYCIVDEKEFQKYRIDSYDVVIARTGASTGESALVINPPRAVFASYLIRLQFEKVPTAIYVGKLLRTNQYFEFIDSIKSGSAQPNANAQQLSDLIIVIPAEEVLVNYFKIVGEIESYKTESQNQSAVLTQIRIALLPKLMNGEIDIERAGLEPAPTKSVRYESNHTKNIHGAYNK
jgi:type I restriction enzyme, S subunit